jgi:hypothetical protein
MGGSKMTTEQQLAIRCACADLIGAMEARNSGRIEDHDWNAHVLTINELVKAYPFLKDYKSQLNQLV